MSVPAFVAVPRPRRSLFRKYASLFVGVVGFALLVEGGLEIWFFYDERVDSEVALLRREAEGAADRINLFIAGIQDQLGWTTQLPMTDEFIDQHYFDAQRLLHQVPAITDLRGLDADGREHIFVSRITMDVIGSGADRSDTEEFRAAMADKRYVSPVYFKAGSEPYVTMAQAGERRINGVTVVEIDLKSMRDSISSARLGISGQAYVVDGTGRLIAHQDISRVLRNADYSKLPQVRAALGGPPVPETAAMDDADGKMVLTAHARIAEVGWIVFIELPIGEALAPVRNAMLRTAALLMIGLLVASLAALFLARRMVEPIRALQDGAERLGSGDFGRRIEVFTGDELQVLAERFNQMARQLEESLSGMERRVAARTEELAEKSRQLELAGEHKSQFLANMSHELRTPLNAILGYTELILDDIYGPVSDPVRDVLARVEVNGAHLLELINTVLDLSKIEAGALDLQVEPCDLGAIVAEVAASMEALAQTKGLMLTTTIAPGLPLVLGDTRRLAQVAFNIVGNAIKFTDHGSVEISVCVSAGRVQMVVRDSGPGIAEADQRRIFDEFQQGDVSIQRASGGTGLGLAISRHIAELHGGMIDVQSALGQGATFRLALPARPELPQVAQ